MNWKAPNLAPVLACIRYAGLAADAAAKAWPKLSRREQILLARYYAEEITYEVQSQTAFLLAIANVGPSALPPPIEFADLESRFETVSYDEGRDAWRYSGVRMVEGLETAKLFLQWAEYFAAEAMRRARGRARTILDGMRLVLRALDSNTDIREYPEEAWVAMAERFHLHTGYDVAPVLAEIESSAPVTA